MPEPGRTARLSLLDRLDAAPHAPRTPWCPAAQYRESVLRDVGELLNTRRTIHPAPATHAQVCRSVYHYGLPDLAALSAGSDEARRELQRQVEEAIQLFEPRLSSVRVTAAEGPDEGGRRLRFAVTGVLRMEGGTERVAFETVLDPDSGSFEVDQDARG